MKKDKLIGVRLEADLYAWVMQQVQQRRSSPAQVIRELIAKAMRGKR